MQQRGKYRFTKPSRLDCHMYSQQDTLEPTSRMLGRLEYEYVETTACTVSIILDLVVDDNVGCGGLPSGSLTTCIKRSAPA